MIVFVSHCRKKMYFSKNRKRILVDLINNSETLFFKVSLEVGKCDSGELAEMSDIMFRAWRILSNHRWNFFNRNCLGTLRKFYISIDSSGETCSPKFVILVLSKRHFTDEEWKIQMKLYVSWFSSWSSALKLFSDVKVNIEIIDKKNAAETVDEFCNLPLLESPSVDNELIEIEKQIRQNHRTFSAGGIFRKALNRHVSVEGKTADIGE